MKILQRFIKDLKSFKDLSDGLQSFKERSFRGLKNILGSSEEWDPWRSS